MRKKAGSFTRRISIAVFLLLGLVWTGIVFNVDAADEGIMHPIMNPPQYTDKGKCPDCGMVLNMWARTRYSFTNSEGAHETCSIRCLADMSMRLGEPARDVKVAIYLDPARMVPAEQAAYVVGSSAKGTMTTKSKIAFASKDEASHFAAANGGEVMDFAGAYGVASQEVEMSRATIDANRKKSGKIKLPGPEERCVTCGMYPARFPEHRSQILTSEGNSLHFCSTRCLVNYQAKPVDYVKDPPKVQWIWVTVYPDGDYDNAQGLYYVVGSKIMGPMGLDALPVRKKADALALTEKEGGTVMSFDDITPDMLTGGHKGMGMHHK
ncbi:MAG: nitrous oxide reductase accessory protein NosL [Deltaproteobacteria bacterium]|nr:nitrous oxide reductase accessory protein NosL [Deltaproteobacteria bacterium]